MYPLLIQSVALKKEINYIEARYISATVYKKYIKNMQEVNKKIHEDSCYCNVTYENRYVKFNLHKFTDVKYVN